MDNRTIAQKIVLYAIAMQAVLFFSSFFENGKIVDIAFFALSLLISMFLFFILTRNIIFDDWWDRGLKILSVLISLAMGMINLTKNIPLH